MVFGSAFLAGALAFWGGHDPQQAVVLGSVPSRALVLSERHELKQAAVFGSAFLAGARVFWGIII